MIISDEAVEVAIEAVLKAQGTALRHYMPAAQSAIRNAMRAALEAALPAMAEPVAWAAEGPGWKQVFLNREAAEKLASDGSITALYASPVAPAEAVRDPIALAHKIAARVATSGKTGRIHQMAYDAATEGALEAISALSQPTEAGWRTAVREIAAERRRQVEVEGWTPEHDDAHVNGEMAGAAACYCLGSVSHWAGSMAIQSLWPWDKSWWKPTDRRRDLIKAGALIVAEIERLDRAALPAPVGGKRDA